MLIPLLNEPKAKTARSKALAFGPSVNCRLTKLVNPVLTLSSQTGTSSATATANGWPHLPAARPLSRRDQILARSSPRSPPRDHLVVVVGNWVDVSAICYQYASLRDGGCCRRLRCLRSGKLGGRSAVLGRARRQWLYRRPIGLRHSGERRSNADRKRDYDQ